MTGSSSDRLRRLGRGREDLPPPAPKAAPRKLQKKNLNKEPPKLPAQASNASTISNNDPPAAPISPTAWAQPARPKSRSLRASVKSERVEQLLADEPHANMRPRPIGQFPSDMEYKSTRVEKPRPLISEYERKRKQARLDDPLESDEYMAGASPDSIPRPHIPYMTSKAPEPSFEGSAQDSISNAQRDLDVPSKRIKAGRPRESIEIMGSKDKSYEGRSENITPTSLATPISETHDPLSLHINVAHSSISRSSTPFDTTTPIDTPRDTPMIDLPSSQSMATITSTGPLTPATKAYDYVALFRALPKPTSAGMDDAYIASITEDFEQTISLAQKNKQDPVAISLLYFWWGIGEDEFKLALLDDGNISDDKMTKALQSILYVDRSEATVWFEKFASENTPQPDGRAIVRESSMSSAVTMETRQQARPDMLKSSDVYRGTGGKDLNDLWNAGKINTAPLTRTAKPTRVDSAQYKRQREWNSSPTQAEEMRQKRACLEERMEERLEANQALPEISSLRPEPRGTEIEESLVVDDDDDLTDVLSNSCYSDSDDSDNEQDDWDSQWEFRHRPGSLPPPMDNIDECAKCSKGGKLICCDSCANSFHRQCLSLPQSLPDQWFCPDCDDAFGFTHIIRPEAQKKTQFVPSKSLRHYFTGVSMEVCPDDANPVEFRNLKSYKSGPHMPRITNQPKPSKAHGEEAKVESFAYDNPHLTRLMENGHVILCNSCGKSSDGARPIITCDYCPSRFHLDCLDPPLTIPPNRNKAWMCPNHVVPDDLVVRKVVDGTVQERRPRRPQNCSLVDIEVLPPADEETIYDDAWAESKRLRVHPGDIVFGFISHEKGKRQRQTQEYQEKLTKHYMRLFKAKISDIAQRSGVHVSPQELAQFQGLLETESRRVSSAVPDPDADAASTLLSLSQAAHLPPDSTSRPVTSDLESSEDPRPSATPKPGKPPKPSKTPNSSENLESSDTRASSTRRRSKRPRGEDDDDDEVAEGTRGSARKRRARTG